MKKKDKTITLLDLAVKYMFAGLWKMRADTLWKNKEIDELEYSSIFLSNNNKTVGKKWK